MRGKKELIARVSWTVSTFGSAVLVSRAFTRFMWFVLGNLPVWCLKRQMQSPGLWFIEKDARGAGGTCEKKPPPPTPPQRGWKEPGDALTPGGWVPWEMRSSWALEPQRFGGKGVHPQRLSTPPPPTPRSRAERVHSRAASLVRTATETLKRGLRSPRNAASRNGALGTRLPRTEPSARDFRETLPYVCDADSG